MEKTKRNLLILAVITTAIALIYMFRDSIQCMTGLYSSCEILKTSLKAKKPVLHHEAGNYLFTLTASSVTGAYRSSQQCRSLTRDFENAITGTTDLISALREAPCRDVGPIDAIMAAARDDNLILQKPDETPKTVTIGLIEYGLIHEKLVIMNETILLERSYFR